MAIDLDAVGFRSEPVERSWSSSDGLLYALGIGAGGDDALSEHAFTTENTAGVPQRLLPTMAVVLAPLDTRLFDQVGSIDRTKLVHGGQGVTIHRELPVAGTLRSQYEIVGIHDKGSGALIATEAKVVLVETGESIFDVRSAAFVRGAGGFGRSRGPSAPSSTPPATAPDFETTLGTHVNQALLYRLSGDRNPLHSDPSFAAAGGFERPILHGLCTYGFTGRALLHTLCAGDPARFRAMDARFSSPVLPGERLTVRKWVVGDGEAVFETVGGDGRPVLTAGHCAFGS